MKRKFLLCRRCGNLIEMINDSGVTPICCGTDMETLVANSKEAATEKHIPVIEITNNIAKITVGEVLHPMEEEHYIEWISLVKDNKEFFVKLYPEQSAEARFPYLKGSTLYAFCNKHGLWKAEVE